MASLSALPSPTVEKWVDCQSKMGNPDVTNSGVYCLAKLYDCVNGEVWLGRRDAKTLDDQTVQTLRLRMFWRILSDSCNATDIVQMEEADVIREQFKHGVKSSTTSGKAMTTRTRQKNTTRIRR